MTLDEYQNLALRTDTPMQPGESDLHALHMLAAEVGEIHSVYQKQYQGHDFDRDNLIEEMGDVLWALAKLARVNFINLNRVAELNIEKLKQRYPKGFEVSKSVNRDERTSAGTRQPDADSGPGSGNK